MNDFINSDISIRQFRQPTTDGYLEEVSDSLMKIYTILANGRKITAPRLIKGHKESNLFKRGDLTKNITG